MPLLASAATAEGVVVGDLDAAHWRVSAPAAHNHSTSSSTLLLEEPLVIIEEVPVSPVRFDSIRFSDKKVMITLTNTSSQHQVIHELLLGWGLSNGSLKKVDLGGTAIYDTETFGSSLRTSKFKDSLSKRTIGAGKTVVLTLEFDKKASTDVSAYDLGLDFGTGMHLLL